MWTNLASLLRHRGLIQSLVVRELKARYRGSVLGFFWSFVNPLLLLSVYTFVFAYIMPNEEERTRPYSVFMFCGLLISGGNLIKKVLFPAEVLPIVTVLANMVHFLLGLPILAAFMVGRHHYPYPANLPWFPLVVLIQLIFTIALALIVSSLTVHFRDLRDLVSNLLTFWFFATPIIYDYQAKNVQALKWLFNINPFFHLSVSYQEILFFHPEHPGDTFMNGHLMWLLVMGAASCLLFLVAYWLFDRLRDSFAEVV
jgi:ABC-type polysaccharide/polyol phosphate export permease